MDVVPSPSAQERVSKKNKNIPLPEGIHLLSSKEIIDLIQTHRHQLELYVTKFNPLTEFAEKINAFRDQFKQLEESFKDLHGQRDKVQVLLENCRILESKYVASWQDYHSEFSEKYGDIALRKKLEQNTKKLDEESSKLETTTRTIASADELDQFIKNYMDIRTQYHLRREKLATWEKQGNLKY
ncbi:ESCRT-I subunit protein SRN2 [Saccharomyces paradoxus]|uniref:ESCRT-I subunit protein SRN2 n=1 Tax=Saccharomyces paradoxus TaxID=27291 RepID=A0A8B8UW09_SACPA|nr:Srn2 [Saccharomyces paradoxus]QHS74859.1 Srn2 [Saccharomyces paradoxus]